MKYIVIQMVAESLVEEHIREASKAFWDQRPCNSRHSDLPRDSAAYFDAVRAKKYKVEPHILAFADHARWKGRKVLEIGCGLGTDALSFVEAGADYTGIDLSPESAELARTNLRVHGFDPSRILCLDAEDPDAALPAGPFDLIYSFGVLHHMVAPGDVLGRLLSRLAPDGEFRVMVYATNSWKRAMIDAGLDQFEAQQGCPIARTYTAEQALSELFPRGFKTTRVWQDHIFCWEIEPYKRGEFVKNPWFAAMPAEVWAAAERQLGWHLLIWATDKDAF